MLDLNSDDNKDGMSSLYFFNFRRSSLDQSELAGRGGGGVPFLAMSGQLCELISEWAPGDMSTLLV